MYCILCSLQILAYCWVLCMNYAVCWAEFNSNLTADYKSILGWLPSSNQFKKVAVSAFIKTCMFTCVHENRRWMLATRAHQSVPYQSRENHHLPPLISFDNYNRSERGHRVKDSSFGCCDFYHFLMPKYTAPHIQWLIHMESMWASTLFPTHFCGYSDSDKTPEIRVNLTTETNHQIDQNWLNIWRNWNPTITRSRRFLSC